MKIIEVLKSEYECLLDGSSGVVRIWAKLPKDGRTIRAIQKRFPAAESYGPFWRLGGYPSIEDALHHFAQAKLSSVACGRLHAVMIHESALIHTA